MLDCFQLDSLYTDMYVLCIFRKLVALIRYWYWKNDTQI